MKRRFLRSQSGTVAVWSALALPFMIGGAAVSIDLARLNTLDHDLQSAADAMARAGAAELDQSADSLTRARRAVSDLVQNDQGGKTVQPAVDGITFLKSLPSPEYAPITAAHKTTNPSEARYVHVTVKPGQVRTLFPPKALSTISDFSMTARSVAGFDPGVCNAAPVFICNPFEGSTTQTFQQAAEDPDFQRRQVKLVGAGPNAQYAPGNFGWLDPFASNSGASVLVDALAKDQSGICLTRSKGVYLRPGKIASMRVGLNVRFDIYEGSFKSKSTDPAYAPAANVVKGYSTNGKGKNSACNASPDINALALPRDSFAVEDSDKKNDKIDTRFGQGDWDFQQYMEVNHQDINPIEIDGVTYRFNHNRDTVSPATPPSRYAMYRWEIDNNCIPGAKTYGNKAGTPEEGIPQCHSSGASTSPQDRRVLTVAVLNCQAIQDSGISMNGRTGALPVEAFAKVFLTEPMGKGQDNIMYGEITGIITEGVDKYSADRVVLAR